MSNDNNNFVDSDAVMFWMCVICTIANLWTWFTVGSWNGYEILGRIVFLLITVIGGAIYYYTSIGSK